MAACSMGGGVRTTGHLTEPSAYAPPKTSLGREGPCGAAHSGDRDATSFEHHPRQVGGPAPRAPDPLPLPGMEGCCSPLRSSRPHQPQAQTACLGTPFAGWGRGLAGASHCHGRHEGEGALRQPTGGGRMSAGAGAACEPQLCYVCSPPGDDSERSGERADAAWG